ncbi:MAG TPA: hypothetical protein VF406_16160 [Thermodesulfobacteriota bacterium]
MIESNTLTNRAVTALTDRQAEIARLIETHVALWGEAPPTGLLARRLGLHRHTVRRHLASLARKRPPNRPA